MHNQVYRKMLGDSAWVQESLVSAAIAFEARQQADVGHAFNFQVVWDQQMPTTSGSIIYGQVTTTASSTTVTGINTVFTQQLTAGTSYLVFGNDSTKTQFAVTAIVSDTSLTIGSSTNIVTGTTSARLINRTATTSAISTGGALTSSGAGSLTQSMVGQWISVAGDTNANTNPNVSGTTPLYQIATVTNATTGTIVGTTSTSGQNNLGWPGSTVSAGATTIQSYTSLALHEYAIALALRPIATPDEARNVVDVSYIDLMGIPLRVMVSYVHIYQALFVTVDFGYALGVIRPDFGVIIQS